MAHEVRAVARRVAMGGVAMLAALLLLGLPAAALGQAVPVPPGNPEADQYFEVTPDATGDKSIDGSRSQDDVLSGRQQAKLEALGPDGVAAAAFAAGTAPVAGSSRGKGGGGAGDRAAGDTDGTPPGAASLAQSAVDREGMGAWLWVILIASVIGALAFGAWRWRESRGG